MPDYHESYLGKMRQKIGKMKVFAISARGIVTNDKGQILLVKRSDNGQWVMPAGSIELEESIFDCVKREVWEEAGVEVQDATLIAIYSDPKYSFVTAYGDPYQMFTMVFRVDQWTGELAQETDETTEIKFFDRAKLPENMPALYDETLADLAQFEETGQVIVK